MKLKQIGLLIFLVCVFIGLSGTATATTEPTFKSYYNTKNPKIGKLVYYSELTYKTKTGYHKKTIHSYVTKITKHRLYLKTYESVTVKQGKKICVGLKVYFEEEMR